MGSNPAGRASHLSGLQQCSPFRLAVNPNARTCRFTGVDEHSFAEEAKAIVQRLFVRAAQRAGGTVALGTYLGLTYSELRRYLSGEAIPPGEVLLKALDLALEDVDLIKSGSSDQAWRFLFHSRLAADPG